MSTSGRKLPDAAQHGAGAFRPVPGVQSTQGCLEPASRPAQTSLMHGHSIADAGVFHLRTHAALVEIVALLGLQRLQTGAVTGAPI